MRTLKPRIVIFCSLVVASALGGALLYKGLMGMQAPKVSKFYVWEDHMPGIDTQGPHLNLIGVLDFEDIAGFDFSSPYNKVTLLRSTGERIISSKVRFVINQIPGNARSYQVDFRDDTFDHSPVPLVCDEVLYGSLEIRYFDSAVIVQLPHVHLVCTQ